MTHAGVDYAFLQGELETVLRANFQRIEIVSVQIDEDADDGGDRVLEITVRFRGSTSDLVRGRPAGLTGMLKDRLSSLREAAFPVLNFVAVV